MDCEADDSYPIADYSYIIVQLKKFGNCSTAVELARYIEWFLTSEQAAAEAEQHCMVTVSYGVAEMVRTSVLERMTCDGQRLVDLVRQQKYAEEESLKTWKLPVLIISPLIAAFIVFLVVYAILLKLKYLRILNRDHSHHQLTDHLPE